MSNAMDIVAEARRSVELLETHWILPWYGGAGAERVWGHPSVKLMLALPPAVFRDTAELLLRERSFALHGIGIHLINARKAVEFAPAIRELLAGDDSVQVKCLAAAALGGLGLTEASLAALGSIPGGAHPEVKKAAILAFRVARHPAAAPIVGVWLGRDGEDEGVKIAAAAALADIGGDDAVNALVAVIENPNEPDNARAAVAEALGRVGGVAAELALIAASEAGRPWVRAKAILGLGVLAAVRHEARLIAATNETEPWMIRQHAVDAMSRGGGDLSAKKIVDLLEDKEPRIRAEAAGAIGRRGLKEALPALHRCLSDADLNVRIQATQSVARITQVDLGLEDIAGRGYLDQARLEAAIRKAKTLTEVPPKP